MLLVIIGVLGFWGFGATLVLPRRRRLSCRTSASTNYSPGTLFASAVYYWQVVAKNSYGSASSGTWEFMTGVPAASLRFVPVTPLPRCRCRDGYGQFGGPTMSGGTTRVLPGPADVRDPRHRAGLFSSM